MTARAIVHARRAKPFYARHPWVFAGALERTEGDPADGDEIDLVSHTGNFIARGLYNGRSKVLVRLYSWKEGEALDADFFRARLRGAVALRQVLGLGVPSGACRLVNSEGDGLSGLTVDRYGGWLVVQFTSLGLANRREMLADLLGDLLSPEGVYLRTEKGIGVLEGLEISDGPLRGGAPPPLTIEEDGLRYRVNLAEGQKTGFYLDQRDNRRATARLASGRRVLDAFCYSGGFSLHAARAGAAEVIGIDASEPALALARENAELNGLGPIAFSRGDVFNELDRRAKDRERFGLVVLDPPKFARSKSGIEEALRGYRRLLTLAVRLVEEDGFLVMCCCSGRITSEMIEELMAQVCTDARRDMQVLERRGASADHPVSVSCPESHYLKCILTRVR